MGLTNALDNSLWWWWGIGHRHCSLKAYTIKTVFCFSVHERSKHKSIVQNWKKYASSIHQHRFYVHMAHRCDQHKNDKKYIIYLWVLQVYSWLDNNFHILIKITSNRLVVFKIAIFENNIVTSWFMVRDRGGKYFIKVSKKSRATICWFLTCYLFLNYENWFCFSIFLFHVKFHGLTLIDLYCIYCTLHSFSQPIRL